eukprot:CAMPEP_0194448936 /NCGR_PEP_ID=MMETSP0176-20130528/129857_1 /TAXON_ID=216777 /ORGANISM="Proboscia alata, Strain PI-D3" /LENGTH=303 /DNA_ID=CAMNT_0039275989 /DNA_START=448 /DNA_END=1359 /DNA_ORIENTATION=+
MISLPPLPLKKKTDDEKISGDGISSARRNMMSQQLTRLHGGNGSYGTMFSLETRNPSKQHDTTSLISTSESNENISNIHFPTIEIVFLSVIIETELDPITKVYFPAQVIVFARLGSFENVEHGANNWMIIHEASVEPSISDKGHFQLTEVGPFLKPMVILGGAAVTERQQLSLYVTSNTMSVIYTNVNQGVGEVFGSFENVEHGANNWMIIHEASVEPSISDKGHFQLTEVGPFLKPMVILGGAAVTERQQLSLYVTSNTMSVIYTNANQGVGEVFVRNEYFDTLVRAGVGIPNLRKIIIVVV